MVSIKKKEILFTCNFAATLNVLKFIIWFFMEKGWTTLVLRNCYCKLFHVSQNID